MSARGRGRAPAPSKKKKPKNDAGPPFTDEARKLVIECRDYLSDSVEYGYSPVAPWDRKEVHPFLLHELGNVYTAKQLSQHIKHTWASEATQLGTHFVHLYVF